MNQNEQMSFGGFLENKRKEREITLRRFAIDLGIAAPYLSDIEKDRRYPPERLLEEMIRLLALSDEDRNRLYDLAALAKENTVSPDLPQYIMSEDLVRVALRKARDGGFKDWQKVIDMIEEDRKGE